MAVESDSVFISYAREDSNEARRLKSDLESVGIKVWFDKESILPGDNFKLAINRAIETCSYFIPLISKNSVKRGYFQKEIKKALDVYETFPEPDIFIIPTRLDGTEPVNETLRSLEWVDLFPEWDKGIIKITKTMNLQSELLEAKQRSIYIKRTSGIDSSYDNETLIKILWDLLDIAMTDDERHEIQRRLTRQYHEFGVSLQNRGLYLKANSILDEAILLRHFNGDPEMVYSLFQKFFNGRQAYLNREIDSIEKLMPGWRDTLVTKLEQSIAIFKNSSDRIHYGNTLHNLAFVYQVLALEHEEAKRFDEAYANFIKAYELYNIAKLTRAQSENPRLIAQSDVRIAECRLGAARYALFKDDKPLAYEYVEESCLLARKVKQYYSTRSQEKNRLADLKSIEDEVELYLKKIGGDMKKDDDANKEEDNWEGEEMDCP